MESAFKAHPRIFVVDDEFSIAQMMSVVLQMNLFDAVPFADPQEALTAARADTPAYLISDISMRGMTGIELAIVMQQELPSCKVLLFFRSGGCARDGQVRGRRRTQFLLSAEAASPH